MSDIKLQRAIHQIILARLAKMNRAELKTPQCYFDAGTRIVLELGKYCVSKDIDFMCSSHVGYRRLREAIADNSLGPIFKSKIVLAREVRADQYGIRTVINASQEKIKFEIVREGRIDLMHESILQLPVPCLTREHAFAEKFLANADRGLDASTLSRDATDLAYMTAGW